MTAEKAQALEEWSKRIYAAAERAVAMVESCLNDEGRLTMTAQCRVTVVNLRLDQIVQVMAGLEFVESDDPETRELVRHLARRRAASSGRP